jgi:hypothetical protein
MKSFHVLSRVSCTAGHFWAPGANPVLIGNPHDSEILIEGFTEPLPIMDLSLQELGECPVCGDVATAVHVKAVPGA